MTEHELEYHFDNSYSWHLSSQICRQSLYDRHTLMGTPDRNWQMLQNREVINYLAAHIILLS